MHLFGSRADVNGVTAVLRGETRHSLSQFVSRVPCLALTRLSQPVNSIHETGIYFARWRKRVV